jgi:iron complex outermembrane receptor protein
MDTRRIAAATVCVLILCGRSMAQDAASNTAATEESGVIAQNDTEPDFEDLIGAPQEPEENLQLIPVTESAIPQDKIEESTTTAQNDKKPRIEEIIVTAQKREQNLQDIPIAVSAISQDAIEERQIVGLADLATQISGFKFAEIAGGGQASIRGVGFSLVTGIGEGSVAMHSDGLFLSRPGATTMLQDDLAGIEVLRGPQGTLYGRNATAGVVNLITPAPPEEFEWGLGAQAGNFSARKYSAHIGSGFFDGAFRLRLSGGIGERDDHLINETFPGRDQGGQEDTSLRLAADWQAADSLKFKLRGFSANEDFNGIVFGAYKPPANSPLTPPGTYSDDPYRIRTNDAGLSNKKLDGGSLKAVLELSDQLSLTSLTGYVEYAFTTRGADNDGTSNDLFTAFRLDTSKTFTQELSLGWQSDRWQWLLGAFYLSEQFDLDNHVFVSGSGLATLGLGTVLPGLDPAQLDLLAQTIGLDANALDIKNYSRESSRSAAVFADTTYTLTDTLRIFGGLRYLKDKKTQFLTSAIVSADAPALGVTNCEDLRSELEVSNTTGRIGLQYDVFDDAMVYAQYSSGFKSGGFSIASCGNGFKPEELNSNEIGFKSTWLDGRLRANGDVFFYDYANLQVEQVVLPSVVVNNADARVKGGELELSALPFGDLQLDLNATVLDARYTKFFNSDNTEGVQGGPERDLSGNYLNRSPKFSGGLSAQYPLEFDSFGRLTLRGEATYNTRTWLREFNNDTDFQKPYALYNLYINWQNPAQSWAIRGFVKNITDEPVLGAFIGVAGYKAATFQLPRTVGVAVSYEFR